MTVCGSWLEVHENRAGHVATIVDLIVVHVDALQLERVAAVAAAVAAAAVGLMGAPAVVVRRAGLGGGLLRCFCSVFLSPSVSTSGLSDPVSTADLFGRLSPGSAPSLGATHVWSVVNTDPPCILPPCHVSVRHVALIMH